MVGPTGALKEKEKMSQSICLDNKLGLK